MGQMFLKWDKCFQMNSNNVRNLLSVLKWDKCFQMNSNNVRNLLSVMKPIVSVIKCILPERIRRGKILPLVQNFLTFLRWKISNFRRKRFKTIENDRKRYKKVQKGTKRYKKGEMGNHFLRRSLNSSEDFEGYYYSLKHTAISSLTF